MSVINAPPRQAVYLLWGQYGAIGGARVHPRGRMWLLTDQHDDVNSPITCRIAWNHPTTGCVQYEDLGEINHARFRNNARSAEVSTPVGLVTMVAAPCVCGAGSVGQALPDDGRITLTYVNPYNRARLTML
jgi:hypothetical protein